jgi:queuine tRNA-ribosyltransferase
VCHLFRAGETLGARLLSYHNVAALTTLVRDARAAIAEGRWAALRDAVRKAPEPAGEKDET